MIWRVEVQARGELHWHGIAICPPALGLEWFEREWFRQLDKLGPVTCAVWVRERKRGSLEVRTRDMGPGWYPASMTGVTRASVPGAVEHAVRIEGSSINGEWLRYLQDHATKAKQEQVGVNIGRHWGIVGRQHWTLTGPDDDIPLSDRQWRYVLRCMQRLVTPHQKVEGVPFGYRLRGRCKRGWQGSAVWFSRPDTIRRIVDAAIAEYPDDFPTDDDGPEVAGAGEP